MRERERIKTVEILRTKNGKNKERDEEWKQQTLGSHLSSNDTRQCDIFGREHPNTTEQFRSPRNQQLRERAIQLEISTINEQGKWKVSVKRSDKAI